MSTPPPAGAVVYALDVPRCSAFYAAVTGLPVVEEAADLTVLSSPTFQLVVHGIPAQIAATIEITDPPVRREDGAVKLVFVVASLASARADAHRLGGELDPPQNEWRWGRQLVCDGHDPEGNVIQFRQDVD